MTQSQSLLPILLAALLLLQQLGGSDSFSLRDSPKARVSTCQSLSLSHSLSQSLSQSHRVSIKDEVSGIERLSSTSGSPFACRGTAICATKNPTRSVEGVSNPIGMNKEEEDDSGEEEEDDGEEYEELTVEERRVVLKTVFESLLEDSNKKNNNKSNKHTKNTLSFADFKRWDEISGLLEDKVFGQLELENIWKEKCPSGGLDEVDLETFIAINFEIDRLFEDALKAYNDDSETLDSDGEGVDDFVDIFDLSIDPATLFHEDDLIELKSLFSNWTSDATLAGKVSYETYLGWEEAKQLIEESLITEESIAELWHHAVSVQNERFKENGNTLTFDYFLRFMAKLESLVEQASEAAGLMNFEEIRTYCQESFKNLTQGGDRLSFDQFMEWDDLKDIFQQKILTTEEIKQLWNYESLKTEKTIEEIALVADHEPLKELDFDGFFSLYETLESHVQARVEEDDSDEMEEEGGEKSVAK